MSTRSRTTKWGVAFVVVFVFVMGMTAWAVSCSNHNASRYVRGGKRIERRLPSTLLPGVPGAPGTVPPSSVPSGNTGLIGPAPTPAPAGNTGNIGPASSGSGSSATTQPPIGPSNSGNNGSGSNTGMIKHSHNGSVPTTTNHPSVGGGSGAANAGAGPANS